MKTTIKNKNRWLHYFSSAGMTARDWVRQILASERETTVTHMDVMADLRIGSWSHSYHYNGNFSFDNTSHAHGVLRDEVLRLADELDRRLHELTAVENKLMDMARDSSSNAEADTRA